MNTSILALYEIMAEHVICIKRIVLFVVCMGLTHKLFMASIGELGLLTIYSFVSSAMMLTIRRTSITAIFLGLNSIFGTRGLLRLLQNPRKQAAQIFRSWRFAALGEIAAGILHEINYPTAINKEF